ncbi:hypothetical protein [Hymenobacter convexus]|uniref:hypothetical protein n=1 Tax=Hymenobacter sp. CA1UV-4 TaxID=3063782 RepID=UPI002712C34E|nr:hypothetical protein [Hymenobacter sp. CA1UV-4]MDO7851458.1 hypothetical protein [Hymenobacter sp. CA1UV-4]
MHLHLPRRYRRPLLLPPGLLALAGLLWLGSVAVGSWREKLTRRSVLQLTMPPKPDSDTIYHTLYSSERRIPFLYSQLFTLYKWQDIAFDGTAAHDSTALAGISKTIESMRADTVPNCGIRVAITPHTRYKSFVRLLDLMAINNQKKYLFDMHHGPFALYVLVDEYTPQPPSLDPPLICGGSYFLPMPLPPTPESSPWELFILPAEWRLPLWLIALMTVLAGWRIFGAWRTA